MKKSFILIFGDIYPDFVHAMSVLTKVNYEILKDSSFIWDATR